MGRKKKSPTKVLSQRIPKCEYDKAKELAKQTDKTISESWRELVRKGKVGEV